MKIFTIGFTQKNAEQFFNSLRQPGLRRVLDIRLNNNSQLAGFTKKNDLPFFLHELIGIEYLHLPELAPTQAILDTYKKQAGSWLVYEQQFLALLAQRQIEHTLDRNIIDGGCLLCSEASPVYCHRRVVAEYLRQHWGELEIQHL
jgi:uncharacterized protein (DUF488 family)